MLLNHHPRKGDAGEGQASRGSGALPGFVDIILEMRRVKNHERQRELTTYSRYEESPKELFIELAEDGLNYIALGVHADADRQHRAQVICKLLPSHSPGMTVDELLAGWNDSARKPGRRTMETDLTHGAQINQWNRCGSGKKGDPYRFWLSGEENAIRASRVSKGARIESGIEEGDAEGVERNESDEPIVLSLK